MIVRKSPAISAEVEMHGVVNATDRAFGFTGSNVTHLPRFLPNIFTPPYK